MHSMLRLELKSIMLEERNKQKKSHILQDSTYMKYPTQVKTTETESRLGWLPGAQKGPMKSNCLMGTGFYLEW